MLIALRDLIHRRRRFAVSVVAVGVVFGIALILSGLSSAFDNESRRMVKAFNADTWVIASGSSGPFTSGQLLPVSVGGALDSSPGVSEWSPLLPTAGQVGAKDVNVVGVDLSVFSPKLDAGRVPTAPFEVIADESMGISVDEQFTLSDTTWTVVGRTSGLRYLAGIPAMFADIDDVRNVQLGGVPATRSFVVRGSLAESDLPEGTTSVTNRAAVADLDRPLTRAVQTIDAVRILLWVVAAGIIGSIMYLSVLERLRDIAVLKAIGSSTGSVLSGLALQAAVVAIAASLIAIVVALIIGPLMPMAVEIPGRSFFTLPLVALVIAGLASMVGARRAVQIDPALAFGG
jgi:putative ABC transport system permease protein